MGKQFAITPVHDLLLRGNTDMPIGLYHLHLATTEQLTRLHYKPGMYKDVGRRLKTLVDHGYVQADSIPTKRFKSPYYYTLAARGMNYLEHIGIDIPDSFRQSKELSESYLHLRHALELNDVLIAALRLKYTHPDYYLARYLHERVLKRQPFRINTTTLIPDGFIEIKQRMTNKSIALLIELDRGTEQQEHFRRRIRAYKTFLVSEAYKQLLNINHITVAFTTFVSSKRVQQMLDWTKAELVTEPQLASMFIFTELPKPLAPRNLLFERRWYGLTTDQPFAVLGE
jgi:Replication-relaxation